MDLDKEEEDDTKNIIDAGAEITGGAMAGAASGFILGGPFGGIVGAVAGGSSPLINRAIISVVGDFAKRILSEREKIRLGGVTVYASREIHRNLHARLGTHENENGL